MNKTLLALLLIFGLGGFGLALDRVRVETGVDRAVAALGVSGAGVIVALLDRGIDWESNDFRHDDGSTRIAFIFDLSDDAAPTTRRTATDAAPFARGSRSIGRLPPARRWQRGMPSVTGPRQPASPPGTGATAPTESTAGWRRTRRSSR